MIHMSWTHVESVLYVHRSTMWSVRRLMNVTQGLINVIQTLHALMSLRDIHVRVMTDISVMGSNVT